jgi:hypothetical protein
MAARQRSTMLDSIERQLVHEPLVETRNRKQLRPNPVAPWELRIGDLRVFYEVGSDAPLGFWQWVRKWEGLLWRINKKNPIRR